MKTTYTDMYRISGLVSHSEMNKRTTIRTNAVEATGRLVDCVTWKWFLKQDCFMAKD